MGGQCGPWAKPLGTPSAPRAGRWAAEAKAELSAAGNRGPRKAALCGVGGERTGRRAQAPPRLPPCSPRNLRKGSSGLADEINFEDFLTIMSYFRPIDTTMDEEQVQLCRKEKLRCACVSAGPSAPLQPAGGPVWRGRGPRAASSGRPVPGLSARRQARGIPPRVVLLGGWLLGQGEKGGPPVGTGWAAAGPLH